MSSYSKLDIKALSANKFVTSRNYWKNRMANFELTSYFNSHCPNSVSKLHIFKNKSDFALTAHEQLYEAVNRMAPSARAKYILLLSTLSILAHKYSFTSDICILTPLFSKPMQLGVNDQIIPVRINKNYETNFQKFVMAVKESYIQDAQFGNYPIEKIIDVDAFKQFSLVGMLVAGLQQPSSFDTLQPDILFSFVIMDGLVLTIEYTTHAFTAAYIEQLAGHFFHLLFVLINERNTNIPDVEVLRKEEKHQLLYGFNNTKAVYPKEETIVSFFEGQVEKTPESIALRYADKTISYRELSYLSNQIAAYLRDEKGVDIEDLVGVMLEREEYLVPCIFGILKAGAAYVPIDPDYPVERINTIAEDAQLKVLITRGKYKQKSLTMAATLVDLDTAMVEIMTDQSKKLLVKPRANNLAYVIYTSGSTGKPKGVMIEQHSVINRLLWMQKKYPIGGQDVLLLKTPITFDVSVWELFWWSFAGASLCLLKPGGEKEPQTIINAIKDNKVTTVHFVPSMLSMFLFTLKDHSVLRSLCSLRQVFSSGEALKPEHVELFSKTLHNHCACRLINLYGPTEATVDVSFYECSFENEQCFVPIGKPIDNIGLHVLDKNNQLCPVGVAGELHIAGVGLARGYLNNMVLTEEKFVQHPCIAGERIYKTGDLARWLPDGNLEYMGRIDHQVKIRGFRIEPGEIEAQLLKHPRIKEVSVITKGEQGDKYLIAYYVSEQVTDPAELISFLSRVLPDFMIPRHYVHLEKMPLSQNGKLDKKALPEPGITSKEDYRAPANQVEEELVKIWSDVLDIDRNHISISQSFFGLGGNSLKIIRLNMLVNEIFSLDFSLPDMFRYTTIVSMAEFINGNRGADGYKTEMSNEVAGMQNIIDVFNEL